ncbi:MAG: 4-(cytidine 5'-diphospho)-2-C-methyl-D-erythritol kinase [Planctomycetaceae bacterium]|nr:4-(cytidine 5'-diphospho)-2-C-methyl-D-erythritol kinase [Planctomycetaceae bacterium]
MRWSRQGETLIVHTPAKLNLFLRVLGRRDDGYHDLETLMVSIRRYDTLQFEPTVESDVSLVCHSTKPGVTGSSLPLDQSNLVLKAAHALKDHTGSPRGAAIQLVKRIPSEAGLGGGSSDAAATLLGLNELWELNLPSAELHALAASLGSDVNFFLHSCVAAVCRGRGERTNPVPVRHPLHFVVAKPQTGLSTGRVFQNLLIDESDSRISLDQSMSRFCAGTLAQIGQGMENDLEPPSRELNEDVADLLEQLRSSESPGAAMSGSGSACFAVCHSARHAQAVAKRFTGRRWGDVFPVSSGI